MDCYSLSGCIKYIHSPKGHMHVRSPVGHWMATQIWLKFLVCLWPLLSFYYVWGSIAGFSLVLCFPSSQDVFVPGLSQRTLDLTCFHWTSLCHIYILTRIFYRGVSGFATDCPCGVWGRGLTTCPLYVGPLFGNLFINYSGVVGLT